MVEETNSPATELLDRYCKTMKWKTHTAIGRAMSKSLNLSKELEKSIISRFN